MWAEARTPKGVLIREAPRLPAVDRPFLYSSPDGGDSTLAVNKLDRASARGVEHARRSWGRGSLVVFGERLVSGAVGLLLLSCSSEPATPESVCKLGAAIIAGQQDLDVKWNAVGTMGYFVPGGEYMPLCTATLVGPQLVLTAKHCVPPLEHIRQSGDGFAGPVFAVGPDGRRPERTFAVGASVEVGPATGGYTEVGSDLAVYQLALTIPDITPLAITMDDSSAAPPIGERLLVLGYGANDAGGSPTAGLGDALRRAGHVTVRARGGNLVDLIYGNKVNCLRGQVLPGVIDPASDCVSRYTSAAPCEPYDKTALLAGYEFWAGATAGDAQTCHGDSGGPLVRDSANPTIVGVVSWGWRSAARSCSFGTVFAVVTNELRSVIASASGL